MTTSRFFAYLDRLRWIKRWGLKRNVIEENVMEHSWQVATIAHMLAVIRKEIFHCNDSFSPESVATAALYHDCGEVITGDMPSPIKYHSEKITEAYKRIEDEAEREIIGLLPKSLQPHFTQFLRHEDMDPQVQNVIKSADLISAFLKCQSEIQAGNQEFARARAEIEHALRHRNQPEVEYFMKNFVESYLLTLDELLAQHDQTRDA